MTHSLFITGSSGFIGRRLFQKLDLSKYDHIYCLNRGQNGSLKLPRSNGKIQIIPAAIENPDAYVSYLACSDTVVHMAATTGKADREEHFGVNAKGTELLVERCKQLGVRNFLLLSTIAVKYPDKAHYFYAQSKEYAECAVKSSGLNYAIIRPTIVIGEDGATWRSLARLAKSPWIPLLGDGRVKVQPIYIEDLVDCLVAVLDGNIFHNEVFELGGPERLTFEAFLEDIHRAYYGKESKIIRIPIRQVKSLLSKLEDHFNVLLPVTAGQLSAFSNDGTIQSNALFNQRAPKMKGINEMVKLVIGMESSKAQASKLERECKVFMNYLINQEPTDYILEKYCEAHSVSKIFDDVDSNPFDKFLLNISTKNTLFTRLVDTYTSLFLKRSVLRRKMVLLLAILESTDPTYSHFEIPDASGKLTLSLKLIQKGIGFGFVFFLAVMIFGPTQLLFSASLKSFTGVSRLWIKS